MKKNFEQNVIATLGIASVERGKVDTYNEKGIDAVKFTFVTFPDKDTKDYLYEEYGIKYKHAVYSKALHQYVASGYFWIEYSKEMYDFLNGAVVKQSAPKKPAAKKPAAKAEPTKGKGKGKTAQAKAEPTMQDMMSQMAQMMQAMQAMMAQMNQ